VALIGAQAITEVHIGVLATEVFPTKIEVHIGVIEAISHPPKEAAVPLAVVAIRLNMAGTTYQMRDREAIETCGC